MIEKTTSEKKNNRKIFQRDWQLRLCRTLDFIEVIYGLHIIKLSEAILCAVVVVAFFWITDFYYHLPWLAISFVSR